MRIPCLLATALSVTALVLGGAASGCQKKSGSGGESKGTMAPDAPLDADPGQPPAEAVERPSDTAGGDTMAPPDQDPVNGMEAAPDPTLPAEGQATARMILIAWKDAENLAEELNRTKSDAKALAEKVLKEARAKPTEKRFGELVRKHSTGPTKNNGGKVGPFGPKDVPAYIAKPVFALKKGEISGIVETPSGYHIFMRTE